MSLGRLLKHIKAGDALIITPRLDRWLMEHPEGVTPDPEALNGLLRRAGSNNDRANRFGASSRGTCLRAQVFSYIGWRQNRGADPVLQNIFNDGTWRHLRWQLMGLQAGLFTDIEVPYSLPQWNLKVSLDGENRNEGWGFELKGTSNMSGLVTNGISQGHLLQVHTCMLASELDTFVYVAEDKRSQEWREIVVRRDEKVIRQVKQELTKLNDAIDRRRLPAIQKECERGQGPIFKGCPYADRCLGQDEWPGQEGQQEVVLKSARKKLPHHR